MKGRPVIGKCMLLVATELASNGSSVQKSVIEQVCRILQNVQRNCSRATTHKHNGVGIQMGILQLLILGGHYYCSPSTSINMLTLWDEAAESKPGV